MGAHHHHHGHDHGPADTRKGKLLQVMGLNLLISLVQIVAGILSGSLALISDALHNFSDFSSQLIAWFGIRIGERGTDTDRSFGYRRAEVIAALVNVVFLFAVAGFLVFEGIRRLLTPREVDGAVMIVVAGIGFVANTLSALILRRDAKHDLNLRAAFLHLASDAATSLGVIVAGLAVLLRGWYLADALVVFPIVVFIVINGWGILKEGVHILMEGTPPDLSLHEIKAAIEGVEGVLGAHHLHAWSIAPGRHSFSAHVKVDGGIPMAEAERILCRVRGLLRERYRIDHALLQLETGACDEDGVLCPG
jgi:cobalt-zinc-cadmium efflux system protein